MRSLLLLGLIACSKPSHVTPVGPAKTEILWDTYGVPHIYGRTTEELFRASGWAQMEAHGDLLLRLYAQARGRAAEYLGEQMLESDQMVRTMGIPDLAKTWWDQQAPATRAVLESFVGGINDWAAKNPDKVPKSLAAMLPITPTDVLSHSLRTIHFTFMIGEDDTLQQWQGADKKGSNAWAIGPSRSASGHAMLLANPHLPWGDMFTWFEEHLVGPDFDCYGATLVGGPTIAIGFNQHVAWTHTVNTLDAADYFELTLAQGGYEFDGKVKPFEQKQETIKVAGKPDVPLVVTRSVHGPVVAMRNGKALALRVGSLDRTALVDERLEMMRAKNLGEFEAALKTMAFPMFNVIYADKDGHIMHLDNGNIPIRKGGTFEDYTGVVPGDRSDTLWTKYLPYEHLPKVVDPPSGWLQNANDPPWTTTFPPVLDPAKFPSYIAPRGMELRPQRSARMVMADDKITFEELEQYKHSTRMEMADRLLDDLIPLAKQKGSERAKRAAAVFEKWDHNADADSKGAVLFEFWAQALRKKGKIWKTPWSMDKPLDTPDGFANPDAALAALDEAAKLVEDTFGKLDPAWGEVHHVRLGGKDVPGNGASGQLGVFRAVYYQGDKDQTAVGGDSFVALVDLADKIRARVLVVYGNWSREGSPHTSDQVELFSKKQLRDAWLSRKDVEAHLEKRELLGASRP